MALVGLSRGEPRPCPCGEVREDSLPSALLHPDTATPEPPPPWAQGAPTPALGSPRALGAAFLPSRSLCRTLSPPLAHSKAGKWLQQILVQLQQREQRYSRAGSGTSDSIRGMLGGLAAAFTAGGEAKLSEFTFHSQRCSGCLAWPFVLVFIPHEPLPPSYRAQQRCWICWRQGADEAVLALKILVPLIQHFLNKEHLF